MATNQSLIHYALDLETPPLLACDTPVAGAAYSPTASEVTCPQCRATEHFPQSQAQQREPSIRVYDVIMAAANLLSDDGENPEYDRAIAELTRTILGAGPERSIVIARILRALKQGE